MFCDVCNSFVETNFDDEVVCIDCALAGYDVDVMEMDLPEAEKYFSKEYKVNHYQGPGAQYSRTYVDVRDGGDNWIVDIYARGGYDI